MWLGATRTVRYPSLTGIKEPIVVQILRNLKVLVLEPPNQTLPHDGPRANGGLGPAYLVGALRLHGIEADYLDGTVGFDGTTLESTFYNLTEQDSGNIRYGMSPSHLAEAIAEYDVIATSSIFTLQTRMHFDVAKLAREVAEDRGRRILLLSGGVNARSLHRHFLANNFDMVAMGEGEQTIVDIVEEYCRPRPDFSRINGAAFRDNGRVVLRPVVKTVETLDNLPFPALDALPLASYRRLGHSSDRLTPAVTFASIQTSRGCQDKCTFCHISMEKLQTDLVGRLGFLRTFSKERVGKDVEQAVGLGVQKIYFEDDNLFFSKKRLADLAPFLKRDGLEYGNLNGANLRFLLKKDSAGDYVVDTEFIEILAEFGLRELSLPFESRNPDILQKYASGKYNPDTMIPTAIVRSLKENGISTVGGFMIGFPDEPWESILRTKEFARQLLSEGLDSVAFRIPVPYPGSLDFERAMQNSQVRADFDCDPLKYTDRMHPHGRPQFETAVPGQRLEKAAHEFWLELNDPGYTAGKLAKNVG